MLIFMYNFVTNNFIPQLGSWTISAIDGLMPSIIVIVGIMLLCSAVGMRISNNLGASIFGGIMLAIGYIVRTCIQALGWIFGEVYRMIPRIYRGTRQTLLGIGANQVISNIVALLAVVLFVGIII